MNFRLNVVVRAALAGALLGLCAVAQAAEPVRLALIEGLSGPFANAGEAVARNLGWAIERVNARGGVKLPGGARPLELVRMDSKGSTEEALVLLRAATDQAVPVVMQGNSSAVAAALVEALNRHNARERSATLVATLHHVDMALAHFPRVIGLRDGALAFDLPAAQVTPAHLHQLYAQHLDELAQTAPPAPDVPVAAAPVPMQCR